MTATGLLIAGRKVLVPGLTVINSDDAPWCKLNPGDYRARKTTWPRQVILHVTKGVPKQYVRAGAGKVGAARNVADFWFNDPNHSAAQLVVDRDGTVLCLADLQYTCAYHATVSNDYSVGIEMYQESDGGVYEATLDATVLLVRAICDAMDIPFQFHAGRYNGHPIARMLNGGIDCVGILGHRDNTEQRGWGDPGDEIFHRLQAAGAEPLDYATSQDLSVGRARQRMLNELDAKAGNTWRPLLVDGLVGPSSLAAAKRLRFERWRDVPTE